MTWGGCEMMVHGVHIMLDLYLNWVVLHVDIYNAFNFVAQTIIFQELPFFIGALDQLSHLSNNFMSAHPHYILACFLTQDLTMILLSLVHDKGILWVGHYSPYRIFAFYALLL
jgi:hypothetical protein